MFETIQTSYELLLPLVERGEKIRVFADIDQTDTPNSDANNSDFPANKSQMTTMGLLIKTQLLICRRFEAEMARLKYPSYAILLRCVEAKFPTTSDEVGWEHPFARNDRAHFIQSAVELIYRTCLISPMNADGLVQCNGVNVLANLLDFYIKIALLGKTVSAQENTEGRDGCVPESSVASILAHCIHTLSGVAYYEFGRAAINSLPDLTRLVVNWKRCVDGSLFPIRQGKHLDGPLRRYAIEGIANVSTDSSLQEKFIGSGCLWPLLRCALLYDPTLDESPSDVNEQDDIDMSVASSNVMARLSVRALGCLSGVYGDCTSNIIAEKALNSLLTPPIARMLRNKRTGAILQFLNSNVERADIIWNVQMREQLSAFLERVETERPEGVCRSQIEELEVVDSFKFDALDHEVRIGGIYVRYFNKGDTDSLSHVEKPNHFLDAVVTFVSQSLNQVLPQDLQWVEINASNEDTCSHVSVSSSEFLLAMNALRILCRIDGLVDEMLAIPGTAIPSVLLSLLELPLQSEVCLRIVDLPAFLTLCFASDFRHWHRYPLPVESQEYFC